MMCIYFSGELKVIWIRRGESITWSQGNVITISRCNLIDYIVNVIVIIYNSHDYTRCLIIYHVISCQRYFPNIKTIPILFTHMIMYLNGILVLQCPCENWMFIYILNQSSCALVVKATSHHYYITLQCNHNCNQIH